MLTSWEGVSSMLLLLFFLPAHSPTSLRAVVEIMSDTATLKHVIVESVINPQPMSRFHFTAIDIAYSLNGLGSVTWCKSCGTLERRVSDKTPILLRYSENRTWLFAKSYHYLLRDVWYTKLGQATISLLNPWISYILQFLTKSTCKIILFLFSKLLSSKRGRSMKKLSPFPQSSHPWLKWAAGRPQPQKFETSLQLAIWNSNQLTTHFDAAQNKSPGKLFHTPQWLAGMLQTRGMGLHAANSDQQYPFFFSPSHTKVNMCYWSTKHKFQIDVPFFLENIHCQSVLASPDIVWDMAQHQLTFIVQASPLTKSVLGRQKSVTVRGELLTVSLYPDIFTVWRSNEAKSEAGKILLLLHV